MLILYPSTGNNWFEVLISMYAKLKILLDRPKELLYGNKYFLWCKNNLLDWPCYSMNICKNFYISFLPLSVWAYEYKKEGVDADKIIGI